MKKINIILFILSIIILFVVLYLHLVWLNDDSRRSNFIINLIWIIFFPLYLPIFGKNIFYQLTILKPRIWLKIHVVVTLIWILLHVFAFSFIKKAMDLPICISRNYSAIIMTVRSITEEKNSQTIKMGINKFELDSKYFFPVTQNVTYQIVYLPNSKYVIDIIDIETNHSLLKNN